MLKEEINTQPLTEAFYYILLSLIKPLHGYGIIQNVKTLTNDRLTIAPGTLYGAINTLIDRDLIKPYVLDENGRKKEYVLTSKGKEQLYFELERLRELVDNGNKVIGGKNYEKF